MASSSPPRSRIYLVCPKCGSKTCTGPSPSPQPSHLSEAESAVTRTRRQRCSQISPCRQVMIMPRTCSQLEGGDHKMPLLACRPCGYRYRCSVLCSKNTSVYTSSDAQFVRVFRTSHGFLFSGKRLSPFSFLNSLLIFSTSTFSHRAQNLDSCTPKLGAHVCSSCIRLLQGVYWAV